MYNCVIITSAGIFTGIELSLYVVGQLYGADVKRKTVVYMKYGDWKR